MNKQFDTIYCKGKYHHTRIEFPYNGFAIEPIRTYFINGKWTHHAQPFKNSVMTQDDTQALIKALLKDGYTTTIPSVTNNLYYLFHYEDNDLYIFEEKTDSVLVTKTQNQKFPVTTEMDMTKPKARQIYESLKYKGYYFNTELKHEKPFYINNFHHRPITLYNKFQAMGIRWIFPPHKGLFTPRKEALMNNVKDEWFIIQLHDNKGKDEMIFLNELVDKGWKLKSAL